MSDKITDDDLNEIERANAIGGPLLPSRQSVARLLAEVRHLRAKLAWVQDKLEKDNKYHQATIKSCIEALKWPGGPTPEEPE